MNIRLQSQSPDYRARWQIAPSLDTGTGIHFKYFYVANRGNRKNKGTETKLEIEVSFKKKQKQRFGW
jgi:hypothetical protein